MQEQPAKIRPARPWPELKPVSVPEPFSRSLGQADFYRRGWRDAETRGEPAALDGYPAPLALAYAAGRQDGNPS